MSSYADAVAAWSTHLREGGTTTWAAWSAGEPTPVESGAGPSRPVPDSCHLELVRRLNERTGEPLPELVDLVDLVDLVLATPSPGRGRVDVPLPWPGADPPAFGNPPIDPQALPEDELVRLAVGVLARILPDVPAPTPTPELTRWPMPWRRRFRLHGSPGTVAAVRRALLAQGLVETDWRPTHVVLARPLPVMMAEHWAAGTMRGGVFRWGTLWNRFQTKDALPARLDVARIARRLASSVDLRKEPVHLVLARDDAEVAEEVAAILGTGRLDLHTGTDPARVDLLRRFNRHSQVALGTGRIQRLAERLADVLDQGRPPVVEESHVPPRPALPWARETARSSAQRVRDEHARAGYAVHGDPRTLTLIGTAWGGVPPRRTLDEALWACREAWRRREMRL
jgi:hypothetical protein